MEVVSSCPPLPLLQSVLKQERADFYCFTFSHSSYTFTQKKPVEFRKFHSQELPCVEFACSHVPVWVLSRYSCFLPQSKDVHVGQRQGG